MLFNKSILAVAVMALANVVVAGTNTVQTPACVLKIIGGTDNPGDSKAICGADAKKIQSQISKNCDDKEASLKFFVDNCAELGHKVASTSATATGSSSAGFVTAASSGHSATQTGSSTSPTGTSASGTQSAGGSSASATFNAASSDRKFDATTFAAAVFIGAAALL